MSRHPCRVKISGCPFFNYTLAIGISHPPYGSMIRYSRDVWNKGQPVSGDLSEMGDDDLFIEAMVMALLNQREATRDSGYYCTIIGDLRRKGTYRSFQADLIARLPRDELAGVLIKAQHNTVSGRQNYGRISLGRIEHEYILCWKRPEVFKSMLGVLRDMDTQAESALRGTWASVVRHAMVQCGGKAELKDLYSVISEAAPEKLASNQHWQAKVRQTLQARADWFQNQERGVWALAA